MQYNIIQSIFYQNDFNWNITPSDHKSKEFQQIKDIVEKTIEEKRMSFSFDKDKQTLKEFIKINISSNTELYPELTAHLQIDKNNFVPIYNRWVEMVKPSIDIYWDIAKKNDIIDGDFYLADLLSENNITLKDKLFVLLKKSNYELDRQLNEMGFFNTKTVSFKDNGLSHRHFWEIYVRPPKEEYWDYIVEHRHLLVPQDVRERKGAFFTPRQWVIKAHEYLAKTFGEDWQDEYYVWDNSAGTGNLLAGLVNKDNLWASTLDRQDVDVMYDRINNGANLWREQVFRFDFLNDDFIPISKGGKLPDKLFEIINNPEKRKKLIFLINPPYGEAGNARTRARKGSENEVENKTGVKESKANVRFKEILGGVALNEKFIQFLARIYADIPDCKMAAFVTPKYINGSNMKKFREYWKADYLGGFATPARTHDNCTGQYSICLFIWDLSNKKVFPEKISCDIFNEKEENEGVKTFYSYEGKKIIDWLRNFIDRKNNELGSLRISTSEVQSQNDLIITISPTNRDIYTKHFTYITKVHLIEICVYFAVRHCIETTWLNARDQFLFPNNAWKNDKEFQNDCFIYTLFHGQNKIRIREGTNHWIPYTEDEVGCKERFESRFMSDFIAGKVIFEIDKQKEFEEIKQKNEKIIFSHEAKEVFSSGRVLWKYYHSQKNININASFYDIREYFQGRNERGTMKTKSSDEKYNSFIKDLRQKLSLLSKKIIPKVYEYGFLLE